MQRSASPPYFIFHSRWSDFRHDAQLGDVLCYFRVAKQVQSRVRHRVAREQAQSSQQAPLGKSHCASAAALANLSTLSLFSLVLTA